MALAIPEGYKRCSRGEQCIHPMGCIQPTALPYFRRNRAHGDGFDNQCAACMNEARRRGPLGLKTLGPSTNPNPPIVSCSRGENCIHPDGPMLLQTSDNFRRSSTKKSGYRAMCNRCEYDPDRSKGRVPKYYAQDGYKLCSGCKEQKPVEGNFYKDKTRRDGLCRLCLTCRRERERERIASDPVYKERRREQSRRKTQRHKSKKRNRNLKIVHGQVLRAKEMGLAAEFTVVQWNQCLNFWDHRCAYCDAHERRNNLLAQDHFVAASLGGGYTAINILPVCKICNSSKHVRDALEWMMEEFGAEYANVRYVKIQRYFKWIELRRQAS